MSNLKFQPKHALNKEQYLQMLRDGIVGENQSMTKEQYSYEIEDHLIYQGPGFVIYKWYGNEFFISRSMEETGEYAFYLNQINQTKIHIDSKGNIEVSWDKDSSWPTVLDYISKDGYPIQFKLFKNYGRK